MKKGYLSQYFEAVAAKRLTAVEVNKSSSNQHEFNGSTALKQVLGLNDNGEKKYFPTKFVWMAEENETLSADGNLSWYDSRFDNPKRAAEYRLYFPTTDVTEMAKSGDLLIIAKRKDGSLMAIIVSAGSTLENQLLWLFGVAVQVGKQFVYQDFQNNNDDKEVDFAVRFILEEIGIDIEEPEADHLDSLLLSFNKRFPKTLEFSAFARKTLKDVDPFEEPDKTLMLWMEQEEKLFRRLERQIVDERLRNGFLNAGETDIDGFISFSLSVQNRRKARAGFALENHLEVIFQTHDLKYTRGGETENKAKPDFLFPSLASYKNDNCPSELLTMLGVKTSCKDRWRQILSEAVRIKDKHLFTLEPGISENQTNEMRQSRVHLVLPRAIHETYHEIQRSWLMNLSDFLDLTKEKQKRSIL